MALAAAIEGGGRFVDDDLQLAHSVGIDNGDPASFIEATRRCEGSDTVAEAVAAYLEQFPNLRDWHLI